MSLLMKALKQAEKRHQQATAVALKKAFYYTAYAAPPARGSDATALGRAAAVVRNRRHIGNRSDADTQGAQGAH